jgi:nicotinamidase-related amidase
MKKALLINDMLNDFLLPGAPLEVPRGRDIVPSLKERINQARKERIPVIYICDSHSRDDEEFRHWPPHAVAGTDGARIIDELKPQSEDYIIEKTRYSGFYKTQLDSMLKRLGIEELIITGLMTNICILYTAVDAQMRGYSVIIPTDSVAELDRADGQFALSQMANVLKAKLI